MADLQAYDHLCQEKKMIFFLIEEMALFYCPFYHPDYLHTRILPVWPVGISSVIPMKHTHLYAKPKFLSPLGTTDIWVMDNLIILCCRGYRMFSSIPGFYPRDAKSTLIPLPKVWQQKCHMSYCKIIPRLRITVNIFYPSLVICSREWGRSRLRYSY